MSVACRHATAPMRRTRDLHLHPRRDDQAEAICMHGWLEAGYIPRWLTRPQMVTYPSINRADVVRWSSCSSCSSCSFSWGNPLQRSPSLRHFKCKSDGSKFSRIVLQVSTHWLTESDFRFEVTVSTWQSYVIYAEKCCHLVSTHAARAPKFDVRQHVFATNCENVCPCIFL